MIGLIPDFVAPLENSLAPNMFPWSVIPIAGISSRCASANIGEIFAAPSSIEYSVWLCRRTKDEWFIGTPVYDRAPTCFGRVAYVCFRFLSVQLDDLLERLLLVALDGASGRRAHWTEQRSPAQLEAQTQRRSLFGGLHGQRDSVLRTALAGSRQRHLMRRIPRGHRPGHPVAEALGPRPSDDLHPFAQLGGQLAAPPFVHHEPIAQIRQVGDVVPHLLGAHRHVSVQVHGSHGTSLTTTTGLFAQRFGPPRNRLPIRIPGSSRLRGANRPPVLTSLGTTPGTTVRRPTSIPPIAASATSRGDTCAIGMLNRSAFAISAHSVGTGPGHRHVTDTPVPCNSSCTASENVWTKALVAEYTAM